MAIQSKGISPLPFKVYLLTVILIVLSGLTASLYLAFSHYRVHTDLGYRSFCAITQSLNCDTVSQSPYSILFGVPVALWGVFAYVFLLLLFYLSADEKAEKKRLWTLIFATAFIYSLMSVFWALISTFYIQSYCIVCIWTYAVNLLTFFYAWLIRRRFDSESFFIGFKKDFSFLFHVKKKVTFLFVPLFACAFMIKLTLPTYWQMSQPPLSPDIPTGLTEDGHTWIGANHPVLVITEWTDYQCFQCKKMHFFLRTLIQKYPDKIRLIHRHFPMDHRFNPTLKEPFHVGSGEMALLSIFAASQNKFWQTNDLLFEMGRQKRVFNTKEIGEKTGLNYLSLAHARKDPLIIKKLQFDILDGIKQGIRGTPSFVIDGKVYIGQIPSQIIEKALK